MTYLVVICVISCLLVLHVEGSIESNIAEYFRSGTEKNFNDEWQKQKKPFQNAIKLTLQGLVGNKDMNVYMQKPPNALILAEGLLLSDNVISLLLNTVRLREVPHMVYPDITFALAHNALRVDGHLVKMFIEADYVLFRNKSAITYPGLLDPYENSPFTFQQVQTSGQLAIVAEGCSMIGTTIASLIGSTVNLGHSSVRVSNCKFSVEIYKDGAGMPPVIAPYFSKQQSLLLESLLTVAILSDVMPKLQGAMFSYVNTSAIFGEKLITYRQGQEKIFKQTSDHMTKVVRALNKLTANQNQGQVAFDDLVLNFDDSLQLDGGAITAKLVNMTLSGLDSAYCAQSGGPYILTSMYIAEEIRFNTLQVRGRLIYENSTYTKEFDFGTEIRDVGVSLKINVDMSVNEKQTLKPSKSVRRFQIVGWRASGFSVIDVGDRENARLQINALAIGHIINEVPNKLVQHISNLLSDALSNPDTGNNRDTAVDNKDQNDLGDDKEQKEESEENED